MDFYLRTAQLNQTKPRKLEGFSYRDMYNARQNDKTAKGTS